MATLMNEFEKKMVSSTSLESKTKEDEITKVTKLTKPVKVTIRTKDMSLETYNNNWLPGQK